MQTLGPRLSFLRSRRQSSTATPQQQQQQSLQGSPASPGEALTLDVQGSSHGLQRILHPLDDDLWCTQLGDQPVQYKEFRRKWDEEYLLSRTQASAQEFQDELKRLGVYEGE